MSPCGGVLPRRLRPAGRTATGIWYSKAEIFGRGAQREHLDLQFLLAGQCRGLFHEVFVVDHAGVTVADVDGDPHPQALVYLGGDVANALVDDFAFTLVERAQRPSR